MVKSIPLLIHDFDERSEKDDKDEHENKDEEEVVKRKQGIYS